MFRAVFGWQPTEFVDAEEVAKEKGLGYGLDDMARRVSGVAFCRRSSQFSDLTIPSAAALRHRAIRVALIYEDVVALKELRRRRDRGLSVGARADGKRKRRDDFEEEDPGSRNAKMSRGHEPERRVVVDRHERR